MINSPSQSRLRVEAGEHGTARITIDADTFQAHAIMGPAALTFLIDSLQSIQQDNHSLFTKAAALRDQVKKTWNPPLTTGTESLADAAQTSVMLTIVFLLSKDFLGPLTPNQESAIDSGLKFLNAHIKP